MTEDAAAECLAFSSPTDRDDILDRLNACQSFDEVAEAGFLFHGTCEAIDVPLRPGAYDGVFWTARSPAVAQAYIPRAGLISMMARPLCHMLDEPVRPRGPEDLTTRWALARAGASWADLEVEEDRGRVTSWRVLPGWPRGRDLVDHLKGDLGYEASPQGIWEVSVGQGPQGQEWKPADWRLPGKLLLLYAPHLQIHQADWGESEIGDANHSRVGAFTRFADQGWDSFSMQDLLQSEYHGNVGHEAIGILPKALSTIPWIGIPALRHDGPDAGAYRLGETEDFTRFMREVSPGYISEEEHLGAAQADMVF
jgi:hypothetical protein